MLYVAVASSTFRRFSTYRATTLAGIFTNSVFGIIYSYAYLALWAQRPDAGGYDSADAVTYVWLGQALLMTVALWGGGTTDDLAERIRSGDVAVDLYRPVNLVWWYLASDLGRAAYHLLTRGLGPTILGWALFRISFPDTGWQVLLFTVSVVLAVMTSFGLRMLVSLSVFWWLDAQGLRTLSGFLAIFFSGMTLPLVVFPEPLRSIAFALPWASLIQTPADLWLGSLSAMDTARALLAQAAWLVVLLLACQVLLRVATRKVVVQGG